MNILVFIREYIGRHTKNSDISLEASSCGLTSSGSASGNMKSPRKNTCYCQNSITSARSEDDQSTSPREYRSRTMRRVGKENKKVHRDRNVMNSKSPIKNSSPPVSPPTPVLSPDTLAALKNAEEIVRNAQEQITEASLFTRSISSRRSTRKHFDEPPPFDDENEQLLYIRELVASKFYEHQSDSTEERSADSGKENLTKQQKLKAQSPARLSQPKFQPLLYENYSKNSSSERSALQVKQARKKNSSPCQSPVDDKSKDAASSAEKPCIRNGTSSKTEETESRKIDDKSRASRNFQVQVVSAIHIERELSVRHLGNIHISPDASFQQVNDNVRIYDVRHESCVESNSKKSETLGKSVTQPKEKNIKESGERIDENRIEIVAENVLYKYPRPDDLAAMPEASERNNEKISDLSEKIDRVDNTKDIIVTNKVQKDVVVNVSENTKDQTEQNCPGQSTDHEKNLKHVVEVPVSHSGINKPATTRKTENESVADVDLITRFIESFDVDLRQFDEIQKSTSDEKSLINERYHMIDLRLKDIHRKYYGEDKEESVNESSYQNVNSTVNSTEENSIEYDIEEINLYKPSLSDLDEILIAHDKVIRRIDRDTDKVTQFLLDRNVRERDKHGKNKSACFSNTDPLNIKLTEPVKMKPSPARKRDGEIKKKDMYRKDISNAQMRKTLFSNSSPSKDNLETVNDTNSGIVSSSAFTDNPPIEEDSQSTSYRLNQSTSFLSREELKNSSDKSKKSLMESDGMEKSTIEDYSENERIEETVDDILYKAGVSIDNDEGVHIIKSNENTNEQGSSRSHGNSLLAYTSDFTGSVSVTQKILSDNSTTKSSSYHIKGLMAEDFRNELVGHQNETETACNILPKDLRCHEENSKVLDNETVLNNDSAEKKYNSNDQESNLTSVETNYLKECISNNNRLEADVENVHVTVVSGIENNGIADATIIGNNKNSTSNQTIEHKSTSLTNTISSIKASDMSHSAVQKASSNENSSKLTLTKLKSLSNRHQQTISEAQESPGHLSSSEDSLRDCTSLQTSASYTKSDKSLRKVINDGNMESVNSQRTEGNAPLKSSSGEFQGEFESTRIIKTGRDQRKEGHIHSIQEATITQFLATSSSVSSSLSDLHSRSLSSTSVEAPSYTRSEGELYMPSSCSYSLGEVRILGKNNSLISQEALKSDSAVTIFVTRSMLTTFNGTENSTPESLGEIRGKRSHF